MKLNHDCVRDLLLAIEDIPSLTGWYTIPRLMETDYLKDKDYSIDDIAYTATCLNDAGFIEANPNHREPEYCSIQRMTYDGHAFLDNIRDPKIWRSVKETTSNLTGASVQVLCELGLQKIRNFVGLD